MSFQFLSVLLTLFLFYENGFAANKEFIKLGTSSCPREQQGLSQCVKEIFNGYIPRLEKGIPALGVPSCEPLSVPRVDVVQIRGPVTVTCELRDLLVSGPSDMQLRQLTINLRTQNMKAEIHFPELRITGKYSVKGQILMLPIAGEGKCSGNYSNVDATVTVSLGRSTDARGVRGRDALACRSLDVSFRVGSAAMHMDDLFGGDDRLGAAMNKFLNDNWRRVSRELQPALEKSVRDFLRPLADRAFAIVRADDILGPVEPEAAL